MGKARKQTVDPADALQERAAEDPTLAAILDALVCRLGLWRLCPRNDCKRARECRGDAAACRAWRAHRPVPQRPDARGDYARAHKVIFEWRDSRDAKA
jgi:hypothetical protein